MCSAWFQSNKFISLCSIVKNSITTTTTTTTTTAAICRVPLVVFVHRLVSEIETGGQGGRNINGNENQNWWYSKIPFPPPSNNHINNLTKLSTEQQSSNWQSFIFEIAARRYVCKSCVNTFVKRILQTIYSWFFNLLSNKQLTKGVHRTAMWSISRPRYLRQTNFTHEPTVDCCVFGIFRLGKRNQSLLLLPVRKWFPN